MARQTCRRSGQRERSALKRWYQSTTPNSHVTTCFLSETEVAHRSLGVALHIFAAMMPARAETFTMPEGQPFHGPRERIKAGFAAAGPPLSAPSTSFQRVPSVASGLQSQVSAGVPENIACQ